MDQVDTYLKHSNGIQYHVITGLLNEFENEVSQMKGTVMDIGCGPGNSTKSLILPKLSKDAVVVGLDVSEKMVECARILNADEKERLSFEQFDIEVKDFPVEYEERFDHGFSFFTLHWIADLRLAFENIYKLLKPGGTFLSQTIQVFNGYNGYLKLAESEKFKEYMKDARRYVTSLYFAENPRAALIEILEDVGFQVLHCSVREKITGYKSQADRKELYTSINPFVLRMPEDVKNEFMDKLMEETLKEENVLFRKNADSSKEDKIFDLYKLMMFHIKKPNSEI
ncbi:juvenile hormone acid O-methyltransferase-like [Leptopilina heterotoma]|uniref:juvenile hormone acid O-methyltransferase-like n=1 Tax=Leptopilina heterotoma TaxID=63436 RepID=UPI001CA87486|nr:juvenile hormone acid O-methyltransferase-like [Leptopilina heterotoma]